MKLTTVIFFLESLCIARLHYFFSVFGNVAYLFINDNAADTYIILIKVQSNKENNENISYDMTGFTLTLL